MVPLMVPQPHHSPREDRSGNTGCRLATTACACRYSLFESHSAIVSLADFRIQFVRSRLVANSRILGVGSWPRRLKNSRERVV
jgi:hypothetical protein